MGVAWWVLDGGCWMMDDNHLKTISHHITKQSSTIINESTKNRRQIDEILLSAALGRFRPAVGWSASLRGHAGTLPNSLSTPSWTVLGTKLAVLGAVLDILATKLATCDGPNGAGERPRTLLEHIHKFEQRSHRFFIAFGQEREMVEPQC